jgi:hypothetical protein
MPAIGKLRVSPRIRQIGVKSRILASTLGALDAALVAAGAYQAVACAAPWKRQGKRTP